MKRQALITILLLCQCLFVLAGAEGLSPYDKNAPVGWGTVDGGITGSDDENPVTVSTLAELKSAMSGTGKKTIYVKGTIEFQGLVSFSNVQNKTVYGLPGSVLSNPTHSAVVSESGILQLKNCKNIILRNLTFKAAGAYDIDGNDNLTLAASEHIWIDHCDFQDGVDGNLDCNNGADYICITWTRFRYLISPWSGGSGGSNDHRFTNLWGGSDSNIAKDGGKLRTTFANCWWDEGCKERMPRIRFGQVHILNCLYSSSVANYCVGAGYRCNAYIEKCAFTSSKTKNTPWKKYATKSGYTDFNITLTGNLNVKDAQSKSGDIDYFVPSDIYTYESYDAAEVEAVVSDATNGAGATLTIEEGQPFTAIEGVTTGSSTVVSTQYYDLQGRLLESPKKGLQLRTEQMSDGRRITTKIIR